MIEGLLKNEIKEHAAQAKEAVKLGEYSAAQAEFQECANICEILALDKESPLPEPKKIIDIP